MEQKEIPLPAGSEDTPEYAAWAEMALTSDEAAGHREVYAGGLDFPRNPIVSIDDVNERVICRMAAFCEMCDGHFVPGHGHVTWFESKTPAERGACFSACHACLATMDPAQVPSISYTD
jgi:hypothetical protein